MDARPDVTSRVMRDAVQRSAASAEWMARCLAALLFGSGAAALIYQVLWIKQLSIVVGAEVYAISIAISGFFGGLALGGWLLGRLADRNRRSLRFYASIEVTVAVAGIATTWLLARAAPWFVDLQAISGILAWSAVFLLVGLPSIAMGGTLPVLVSVLVKSRMGVGRAGGGLYAANTAGAIVGALLPAFVLIPLLGMKGTSLVAALINIVAATAAIGLDRFGPFLTDVPRIAAPAEQNERAQWAIGLYGAAGGVALGYEVVWSQAIVQFMSTRSFAFSVVLATYLAGIAIGAAMFARWSDRFKNPGPIFGLLIAAAGWVSLVEIAVLGHWLVIVQTILETGVYGLTASNLAGMSARFAVAAICFVFVPTLLLGAAFPAVLKLVVGETKAGRDVGRVVAINTLGGIAGTLVTGFILLPWLGLVRTFGVLAIAAALIGIVAVMRFAEGKSRRWPVFAIAAASAAIAFITPVDQLARLLPAAQTGRIAFYEESAGGTVAVVETSNTRHRFHRLYIQGVSNSGDAVPSLRYMRLQALLPLIIHNGEPKSALVIGYGTGITAGVLSQFPALQQRIVSELLPAVLRAAPRFEGTFNAAGDSGLEKRVRDGRQELQRNDQRYDLITLEPPPPSAAGVVNLYSSDFYNLAASRLNEKGILAQWLPLPTQNEEDTRALVRSFIDIFPYASLWSTELHETMLVGSLQPIDLNIPRITARFEQPQTRAALSAVGINSPAALLATWITDRDGLQRFAGNVAAVTDDWPAIEYATWVRSGEFARTFAYLKQFRSDPPLRGADQVFISDVSAQRDELDVFYQLGLSVYSRDRTQYARNVDRIIRVATENPYYRWFINSRQ